MQTVMRMTVSSHRPKICFPDEQCRDNPRNKEEIVSRFRESSPDLEISPVQYKDYSLAEFETNIIYMPTVMVIY